DKELRRVEPLMPQISDKDKKKALLKAQKNLIAVGITGISDMSMDEGSVEAIKSLAKDGELLIDVEGVFLSTGPKFPEILAQGPHCVSNAASVGPLDRSAVFSLRYWKRYLDGSLGARSAWLMSPYSDAETFGKKLYEIKELTQSADEALRLGFGLSFHCIGD